MHLPLSCPIKTHTDLFSTPHEQGIMDRPRRTPKRKALENIDAPDVPHHQLLEKACSPLTSQEIEEWALSLRGLISPSHIAGDVEAEGGSIASMEGI